MIVRLKLSTSGQIYNMNAIANAYVRKMVRNMKSFWSPLVIIFFMICVWGGGPQTLKDTILPTFTKTYMKLKKSRSLWPPASRPLPPLAIDKESYLAQVLMIFECIAGADPGFTRGCANPKGGRMGGVTKLLLGENFKKSA